MSNVHKQGVQTYSEELDMIQNLVVEREVIARDDVDACVFLNLPVSFSQALALSKEVGL